MPTPWWLSHVDRLEREAATSLGGWWHRSEQLKFLRDTIDPIALKLDLASSDDITARWATFLALERGVAESLSQATLAEQRFVREGGRPPDAFRAHWETLGFAPHADFDGTPADDYLDALFLTSRLRYDSSSEQHANVNLGSRASRVSDFLIATALGADDVVFDLGSGSGKLALTVAASTQATVRGIELLGHAVDGARSSASSLGLGNATFTHADVRDVDLSSGSAFYLYYPFRGEVASSVARTLGQLAREKPISIYASGPSWDYGEFFLREVDSGALRLVERRGEFSEVLVLESPRLTTRPFA